MLLPTSHGVSDWGKVSTVNQSSDGVWSLVGTCCMMSAYRQSQGRQEDLVSRSTEFSPRTRCDADAPEPLKHDFRTCHVRGRPISAKGLSLVNTCFCEFMS
jgi:hypothetical protein